MLKGEEENKVRDYLNMRVKTGLLLNELTNKMGILDIERRKTIPKFGINSKDTVTKTTSIGDEIDFHLGILKTEKKVVVSTGSSVVCRRCNGGHWTIKCPFKDSLAPIEKVKAPEAAPKESNVYVAPSRRPGAVLTQKEDENTVRIANLSEDAREDDIRAIVTKFGPVQRCFVAMDRDLGVCKGYAFVSFYDSMTAKKCIARLNGFGYDSLILSCDFANSQKK